LKGLTLTTVHGRNQLSGRTAAGVATSAQLVYMQEHHMPKSLENETGTIVELWKIAVSLYPDIVDKYGEFSGELLQAMLGIEIVDKDQKKKAAQTRVCTVPEEEVSKRNDINRSSRQSPESKDEQVVKPALTILPVLEDSNEGSKHVDEGNTQQKHSTAHVRPDQDDDDFVNMFVNPNARLIRSMRRCEDFLQCLTNGLSSTSS